MAEPALTPGLVRNHSLTAEEYARLKSILGDMLSDPPEGEFVLEPPAQHEQGSEPATGQADPAFTLAQVPDLQDAAGVLERLLRSAAVVRQTWTHGLDAPDRVVCPGSDALVVRVQEIVPPLEPAGAVPAAAATGETGFGISLVRSAHWIDQDPRAGARRAVDEAVRNLTCSGAVPLVAIRNLAATGSATPEVLRSRQELARGLAESCAAFDAPLVAGKLRCAIRNSNEANDPLPVVAVIGLIERAEHITSRSFKDEGDAILLLGNLLDASDASQGLEGSVYLHEIGGKRAGRAPQYDLAKAKELNLVVRAFIHSGAIKSAHNCAAGGLAVALAQSCVSDAGPAGCPRQIGAQVDLSAACSPEASAPLRLDGLLFGEAAGRVLITVAPTHAAKVLAQAKILDVSAVRLGTVGGGTLQVTVPGMTFSWETPRLVSS